MSRARRRYHLLVYSHMLNRWWPATLTLAIALFALAWGLFRFGESWGLMIAAALGGLVLVATVFLFLIRNMAYIQLFDTHLRLVTPFLRFNVSYRRFRGTTTSEMRTLFPPGSVSKWRRGIIAPLAGKTALVINLNGFPLSPWLMRLFLSPLFFKDNTPHLVILVGDWLRFSTELDSIRLGGGQKKSIRKKLGYSILSRLPD